MNKEKFTRAGLEPCYLRIDEPGLYQQVPARQSGGRRFKSRSSKFFFVHPNLSQNVPSLFPLWFMT